MHTVLLIDDNDIDQQIMRRFFACEGIPLAVAKDGEEGLRMALELHPALILLDNYMPVLDGFETLGLIRKEELLKDVPIIMYSGECWPETRERALAAGATDFLSKPFQPQSLLMLLKQYGLLDTSV
jgi:CheY-like chemotaxis protein